MTKKQKEEIKNFLIYLHLTIMSEHDLTADGFIAVHQLSQLYPNFNDIKKENQKIFEWIDKENENE